MEQEYGPLEMFAIILFAVFFTGIVLTMILGLFVMQLETFYAGIFHRPFFVHFYPRKRQLHPGQAAYLRTYSHFYNQLSPKRKTYFEHRLSRFLEKYEFVGRDGFVPSEEVRVRIASKYIMLSFGWRNYLTDVFEKILVYPAAFESPSTGNWHKGEFNPAMRVVVFSWEDFLAGDDVSHDNLNLGIHEFAHVMHFHGAKAADVSAVVFARLYAECLEQVQHPANQKALRESGYLRDYAYTNSFEFLAVVLEHYFETPEEFRQKFPHLFVNIRKMLNHR